MNKHYLGDGVYVEVDMEGRGLKLTTSDGLEDTNTIYMEPLVFANLQEYYRRLTGE